MNNYGEKEINIFGFKWKLKNVILTLTVACAVLLILLLLDLYVTDISWYGVIIGTGFLVALMLGYAAENVLQKEWLSKKSVIAMFCLFAIAIVTIESLLTVSAIRASSDATFFDLLGIPLAFCIFAAFRGIALNIKSGNPFFEKAVIFLGSCTFGVYLLEDYSRNLLSFICDMLADKLTLIPACLIWLVCSYLLTVIVVAIIKKTPILRKIGV